MTLRSSAAAAPPASVASRHRDQHVAVRAGGEAARRPAGRAPGWRRDRSGRRALACRPMPRRALPATAIWRRPTARSSAPHGRGRSPCGRGPGRRRRRTAASSSVSRSGVDISRAFSAESGGVSGRLQLLDREADLQLDRRQGVERTAACRRTAGRRALAAAGAGLPAGAPAAQLGDVDRLRRQLGVEARRRLQVAQRGAAIDRLAGEHEVERVGAQLVVAPAQVRAQVQGQGHGASPRHRAGPGRPRW